MVGYLRYKIYIFKIPKLTHNDCLSFPPPPHDCQLFIELLYLSLIPSSRYCSPRNVQVIPKGAIPAVIYLLIIANVNNTSEPNKINKPLKHISKQINRAIHALLLCIPVCVFPINVFVISCCE